MGGERLDGHRAGLEIDDITGDILANYDSTQRAARRAAAALEAADQAIERINASLPEGVKVGTMSWYTPVRSREGIGGPNRIYRPDNTGRYIAVGEICTNGASYPFLGDRVLKTDDGLVVVNEELGVGLSVGWKVFLVDTTNDPLAPTLGGSQNDRFRETLLPMIEQVQPGETKL